MDLAGGVTDWVDCGCIGMDDLDSGRVTSKFNDMPHAIQKRALGLFDVPHRGHGEIIGRDCGLLSSSTYSLGKNPTTSKGIDNST